MLLLSEEAVRGALSMSEAIHVQAQAFLAAVGAQAQQMQVPAYSAISVPSDSQPDVKNVTLFKPALLDQALGIKVVGVRPVSLQHRNAFVQLFAFAVWALTLCGACCVCVCFDLLRCYPRPTRSWACRPFLL